jgi:small-conductance mechanosensitive channel
MGIDWWESDSSLNNHARELEDENRELRERLNRLEQRLELLGPDETEAQEVRQRE